MLSCDSVTFMFEIDKSRLQLMLQLYANCNTYASAVKKYNLVLPKGRETLWLER